MTSVSVLKDVVAFVDVWSSARTENYSRPFIDQLLEMGAEVSKTFNKRVTHVVFQHGRQSTWDKAKKAGAKLVSVLWVDRCKDNGEHVDENLYPAAHEGSNINQVLNKRMKHRCMQPRDVPERTPETDRRMRKKLDRMMKDLAPSSPVVPDASPFFIDEESGIVYSPSFKRSDAMLLRLREMKESREKLSPTASQMVSSQSPSNFSCGKSVDTGPVHTFLHQEDEESECDVSFTDLQKTFANSMDKEKHQSSGGTVSGDNNVTRIHDAECEESGRGNQALSAVGNSIQSACQKARKLTPKGKGARRRTMAGPLSLGVLSAEKHESQPSPGLNTESLSQRPAFKNDKANRRRLTTFLDIDLAQGNGIRRSAREATGVDVCGGGSLTEVMLEDDCAADTLRAARAPLSPAMPATGLVMRNVQEKGAAPPVGPTPPRRTKASRARLLHRAAVASPSQDDSVFEDYFSPANQQERDEHLHSPSGAPPIPSQSALRKRKRTERDVRDSKKHKVPDAPCLEGEMGRPARGSEQVSTGLLPGSHGDGHRDAAQQRALPGSHGDGHRDAAQQRALLGSHGDGHCDAAQQRVLPGSQLVAEPALMTFTKAACGERISQAQLPSSEDEEEDDGSLESTSHVVCNLKATRPPDSVNTTCAATV